ncbi:hypothetical protein [Microbacterium sp. 13-71-7]|uniref:hypothetical protein n=1 Tax=Microbacterium sp. 13-71-7 TaxID=1970399 RepID=UPI0025D3B6A7|nr:hypothetical protein [Microbacterium sp. 13-71-7]
MRYLDNIAPRSKWAIWAWSPVIVLRVALVGVYLGYVYSAVIAFVAGVPIFRLTTPQGYTAIWAVLLGVSALLSAVGSLTDRWQQLEKWASLALSSLMSGYVGALNGIGFAEGDLNRQFAGAVAAIAFILPAVRFVYLAAQTGKRRRVPRR